MEKHDQTLKICFSAKGENLDSEIDSRFGRCEYFVATDIDKGKITNIQAVKNPGIQNDSGAGISAARQVGEMGADILVTGEAGPKARAVLDQLQIKIIKKSGRISSVLAAYADAGEIDRFNKNIISSDPKTETDNKPIKSQRVFIPLMDNKGEDSEISLHFGHAPYFGLYESETGVLTIEKNKLDHGDPAKSPVDQVIEQVDPTIVYARDIGARAVNLFKQKNISLKTGPYNTAKELIANMDKLESLDKSCSH